MVVTCYSCGQYLLAKAGQKTKLCTYCGARLLLAKARKVAYAKKAREASTLIRKLKEQSVR